MPVKHSTWIPVKLTWNPGKKYRVRGAAVEMQLQPGGPWRQVTSPSIRASVLAVARKLLR